MASLVNGTVIRRCSKCQITEDVIPFWTCKDSKNGNIYTHNICIPCRKESQSILRIKRYYENRDKEIAYSTNWNNENRLKIRKLAKIRRDKKRMEYLYRGYDV